MIHFSLTLLMNFAYKIVSLFLSTSSPLIMQSVATKTSTRIMGTQIKACVPTRSPVLVAEAIYKLLVMVVGLCLPCCRRLRNRARA